MHILLQLYSVLQCIYISINTLSNTFIQQVVQKKILIV